MSSGIVRDFLESLKQDPILTELKEDLIKAITSDSNSREPSTFFTPSSMICKRQMYYKARGFTQDEQEPNYQLTGMGESGTDRHSRLQEHMCNLDRFEYVDVAEYINENNLPLEIISHVGMEWKLRSLVHNISFLVDGILRHKETGKYYIAEIKTEISFKFNYRKSEDMFHRHQAIAYVCLFGIEDTIFIYESRDSLELKFYKYVPSDKEKEMYFNNKIKDTLLYVKTEVLPPKVKADDVSMTDFVKLDKVCQYCRFKSYCEKDENDVKS